MSPTGVFTVTDVIERREFQSQHGPMVAFKVAVQGHEGGSDVGAELKQKPSSRAPEVGDEIEGELLPGRLMKDREGNPILDDEGKERYWPPTLKRLSKGAGGGSGGQRPSKGEFRTPEQLMYSDAMGKTLHWCDIKVAAGEWKPITWDDLVAMCDRVYEKIKAAQ